jgi:formate hydrogenlyase subunit 3/multisubunit Na+/H+ antiporter MnhD subunit
MGSSAAMSDTATAGGLLLVMALIVPASGILLQLMLGGPFINRVAFGVLAGGLAVTVATFAVIWQSGQLLAYVVGGWPPPLGIALRADGISAAMMLTTAIVICATALFARKDFAPPRDAPEARGPFVFWPLLFGVWCGLNAVFVSGDLFTLYVALELLTFAAVPLVCLKGGKATLQAALRYLMFALLGSMLYLLGTAMLYGTYGTLDIALLSKQARPVPVAWIAAALMTVGLLAKTALFPLHLWLPPAHAGAPPAGSAVLSALVVKGSFFLIVRLWFDALPALRDPAAAQLLAGLGSAAILFGSVLALRQQRLKLLVAYSTVAQIGYLFFLFPLVTVAAEPWSGFAWTGGWLQLFSHAFAKAAMFMAAGLIAEALGHDRIADLKGAGRALPLTFVTFGLAGLSLMGIPPSGGFTAKWLLLLASVMEGQWWWAVVMLVGGLLAGGYVFMVLGKAFSVGYGAPKLVTTVARSREMVALALALCAVFLGFVPLQPAEFLQVGRPDVAGVAR